MSADHWEVVRVDLRGREAEVLGRYRFKVLAVVHHWWSNIGLRMSVLRQPTKGAKG